MSQSIKRISIPGMTQAADPILEVLVPVLNEEQILRQSAIRLMSYLDTLAIPYQITFGSNGSTDASAQMISELAQEFSAFEGFHIAERGCGRVFKRAMKQSRADYLITFDCDLCVDLSCIEEILVHLKDAPLVIGTKTIGTDNRSLWRKIPSRCFAWFTRFCLGVSATDYAPSHNGFRRADILPFVSHLDDWTGFTTELIVRCVCLNQSIPEVNLICDDIRPSRFNLLHELWYRTMHVCRLRIELWQRNSWYYQQNDTRPLCTSPC
jgi:glycosyltransferase involved in cell wall biosynthesis